jgi:hypothetical protein
MKPRYEIWTLFLAAGLIALLSSGCYTQFGTVRDEGAVRYEEGDQNAANDTTANAEDYEYAHERFYEQCYYPGFAFGLGFYGPWWGYDPYWYDPYWGWCGTSYPYYWGWWSPPIAGWRAPLAYGLAFRRGYGFGVREVGPYGASRGFGSTRSSSGMLGGTGYAPGGTRSVGTSTLPSVGAYKASPRSPGTVTSRSANRSARVVSPNSSRSTSRSVAPRSYPRSSGAGRQSGYAPRSSAPSAPPSGGSGGRVTSGGSRSGGGSAAPRSSPPPSGGGGAPANSGGRGGNRR